MSWKAPGEMPTQQPAPNAAPWAAQAQPQAAFTPHVTPPDPLLTKYGHLDRDNALIAWNAAKKTLDAAKEAEMELRKYVVLRGFPEAGEGTTRTEIGGGWVLKCVKKFNYKFNGTQEDVESLLDKIDAIGEFGKFIADRVCKWMPEFRLTEYRALEKAEADGTISDEQRQIKALIDAGITRSEGAPELELIEPKK